MRKIILIIFILISSNVYSQVDSNLLRSGKLTLRINDWEYLFNNTWGISTYEDLNDSLKARLRPNNVTYPSPGTTLFTIDSVTNGEIWYLCLSLNERYNKVNGSAIDRILTAVRAMNSFWINKQLNAYDANEAFIFLDEKVVGKKRLKKT